VKNDTKSMKLGTKNDSKWYYFLWCSKD